MVTFIPDKVGRIKPVGVHKRRMPPRMNRGGTWLWLKLSKLFNQEHAFDIREVAGNNLIKVYTTW
jgi:hypothetical protein